MYDHILVPLDGSKLAEGAIPHAEALATGCGAKDITLIQVVERTKGYKRVIDPSRQEGKELATEAVSKKEREARKYLAQTVKKLEDRGFKVREKVLIGDAAQAIVFYAEHNPCDIIVMASHGRSGVGRWALGSVADKVFRASLAPILMVRVRRVRGV